MLPKFSDPCEATIPLHVIDQSNCTATLQGLGPGVEKWAEVNGFNGALGQALVVPGSDGSPILALAGYGSVEKRVQRRFGLSMAVAKLPATTFTIASGLENEALDTECFGWLMSHYSFDRYHSQNGQKARLCVPEGVDPDQIENLVAAECLIRDLINTPASDMGPAELQASAEDLARVHNASISVIEGSALLEQNLPMIHAVGRAADCPPRLIDMRWGNSGPKLTLVGKGVCFDTGGLNLKPGRSMGLMKKDMGGAAHVLGLAQMIMTSGMQVQLRVLIPAVENAVSGNAIRPGDILKSRKGLTVEINNTDAEGRLVLADALALAAEDSPDLIVSMATLTGAARVAVGPDIAPFFTDDEPIAAALAATGISAADPVWRLPFHDPYDRMIEPGIADLDNAPSGGFAGAITAALFLRRFVGFTRYVHFDLYGWSPSNEPARPKGGLGQGVRALLAAMPGILKP
jgi:leucyl aminopeptidase